MRLCSVSTIIVQPPRGLQLPPAAPPGLKGSARDTPETGCVLQLLGKNVFPPLWELEFAAWVVQWKTHLWDLGWNGKSLNK